MAIHEESHAVVGPRPAAGGLATGGLGDLVCRSVNADPANESALIEPAAAVPPPAAGPTWLARNPVLRRATLMLMDAVLLGGGLAVIFVGWLYYRHGEVPPEYLRLFSYVAVPIVALRVALLYGFGLYSSIARYAGNYELRLIALADTIALAAIAMANLLYDAGLVDLSYGGKPLPRLPWGVVINDWMLALITVSGVRLLRREIAQGLLRASPPGQRRVLIVGAGDTGEQVARDLIRTTGGAFRPVAYVDPDPKMIGLRIHGLPVAGGLEDLERVISEQRPDEIVIALARPTPRVLSEIVDRCRSARLEFKIVPPLPSVMSGGVEISMLRPVEIEDLLGREPIDLGREGGGDYLSGKRVLVTGAGGSIGLELCRQALLEKPASLVLLGRGENSLFEALIELKPLAESAGVELKCVVGDVRDRSLVEGTFAAERPQVLFHAAAHKHVHFMELQPAEAVKNNVLGTLVVAEAAIGVGVERFISISTDKAVRPTGIMGATKRLAEMVVSSLNARAQGAFMSVRFGNVLGSRGSVIPTFRRQIEQGGPVTVTHPEVTRFFMTTAEAVSLVIQAGARGRGGELYVLDMGRPVRIADLARNLITLSGLEPGTDIAIEFTGLRPGEKLTEELLTEAEGLTATENGKIYIAKSELRPWEEIQGWLDRILPAAAKGDGSAVREMLREFVPDFRAEGHGATHRD